MMFLDIIYNILTPFRCSPIVHVHTVNEIVFIANELLVRAFVNERMIVEFFSLYVNYSFPIYII